MKSHSIQTLVAMSLIASMSGAASAQTINVRKGVAQVTINPVDDVGLGSASYITYPRGNDFLVRDWWWYRIDGVSDHEYALPSGGELHNNGSSNVIYTVEDAADGLLDFELQSLLQTFGYFSSQTILYQHLYVTNKSEDELSLSIFHYVDLNVQGQEINVANWDPQYRRQVKIVDPQSRKFSNYEPWGEPTSGSQFAPHPELLDLLTDSSVDNFDGSGLPFAPADWSGGFEWTTRIAPHEEKYFGAFLSTNRYIPAPGTFAVLGLGGLAIIRRRQRRD